MTKIIQAENPSTELGASRELYQCEECGFRYEEKEWAEKCEACPHTNNIGVGAWCKKHQSCPDSEKNRGSSTFSRDNIEITAHAIPQDEGTENDAAKIREMKFNTRLFYALIGIASSLAFFLALYWVLRLDSAITNIIVNTYGTPLYFWPYVVLTIGAIALFGVNVSFLVYRWRKFGPPKLKTGSGTGLGSLVGIAASACPVCGSTLLSAIGIAGGLAAFPLQGLELKTLSFAFMALPIWLVRRDLKKLECGDGTCPVPKDHRFKESDRPWLATLIAVVVMLALASWNMLKTEPVIAKAFAQNPILNPGDNTLYRADISGTGNQLIDEVAATVLPESGFQSKIALGDSAVKLVQNGVIDRDKFLAIYADRGGLPDELENVLDSPSTEPILLTRENANYYVNLLWPLGLANYMPSNRESPINGASLFNFASTGGWNLGKEENGGAYFNKFRIVELAPEQEALAVRVAQNSYRPCCNNSTFFQDCNHGSALLGLLALGASQGLIEGELWREALAFNSFWFPHNYLQTALYFKAARGLNWDQVDARLALGKEFSSGSGWHGTVAQEVERLGLLPKQAGGAGCGV